MCCINFIPLLCPKTHARVRKNCQVVYEIHKTDQRKDQMMDKDGYYGPLQGKTYPKKNLPLPLLRGHSVYQDFQEDYSNPPQMSLFSPPVVIDAINEKITKTLEIKKHFMAFTHTY